MKYSVTPGMSRVFGKRTKRSCENCGLSIPVYPGRYPTRCPHCGVDPILDSSSIDDIVNLLLDDSASLPSVIEALVSAQGEEKSLALDKLMQKIGLVDLLDSMVGIKVADNSTNIWIYFSESADEQTLRDLVTDLKHLAVSVELFPVNESNARWCISVLNPRSEKSPELIGTVDAQASLSGEVDVRR